MMLVGKLEVNGARRENDGFFNKSGVVEAKELNHTPYVVIEDGEVWISSSTESVLRSFKDEATVLCQWRGNWRSDFFAFTVGELRAFVNGRK